MDDLDRLIRRAVIVGLLCMLAGGAITALAQEAPGVPTEENLLRRQVQAMERQARATESLTRAVERMSRDCR